jgi:prepilin-type N-terminal cleavage/methylation domain-containing protein
MKTEFKAKFLQHVAKKRKEEGFTLIELLVVIIIIGILSAIALPSFLNQANKAKQSEAKTYVGSINKGQQAYYTEKTTFTTSIEALGVGIELETTNYTYSVDNETTIADEALTKGTAKTNDVLNSYHGMVYLVDTTSGGKTSRTILCETTSPGQGELESTHTDCSQGSMKAVGG